MSRSQFQFGKTAAAINLADILFKEHPLMSKRVSSKIHKYQGLFNSVKGIEDLEHRALIAGLLMSKAKESFKNMNAPTKIKSHSINILTVKYRETIKNE